MTHSRLLQFYENEANSAVGQFDGISLAGRVAKRVPPYAQTAPDGLLVWNGPFIYQLNQRYQQRKNLFGELHDRYSERQNYRYDFNEIRQFNSPDPQHFRKFTAAVKQNENWFPLRNEQAIQSNSNQKFRNFLSDLLNKNEEEVRNPKKKVETTRVNLPEAEGEQEPELRRRAV